MPFDLLSGKYIAEKTNVWRDACDGHVDWLKEHLDAGAPINSPDLCGDPPLLLAAGGGQLAAVKLLVEEGADLEIRNVMKETPLIRAAHNGHVETVRYLLSEGAEINALDLGDNTALHWASMRGHLEVVKVLLAAGANRSLRNKQGKMPMDLSQPCWSPAYRYVRQVLAAS